MLKQALKRILPSAALSAYHKTLAILANVVYRFPSRQLIVIGVTGTKGKSSTVLMITRILEEAGYTVGSMNTIFFKVGKREWPNDKKQGMLGRFQLQKLLRQMVRAGCSHAVIEVTSEGVSQHRHWGIAFDVAVFTNLSPEHIESHGSYEKYRQAKAEMFRSLAASYRKAGQVKKVIIVNALDPEADYFFQFAADEKYSVRDRGEKIRLQVPGEFMRTNALLALAAGRALGIAREACVRALEKIAVIPGRAELLKTKLGVTVVIDYAHEPKSFEAILSLGRELAGGNCVISVFGATGGGRDRAKRPIMGKLAAQYSDCIILTTDDPYDDDPLSIINDILPGIINTSPSFNKEGVGGWSEKWEHNTNLFSIVDRAQAIKKALSLAESGDTVLLLGKGSERVMAVAGGKTVPWSDREAVEELL